mgnify:CR=1 FL=1
MDFHALVSGARTCRRYHGERRLEEGTLPWLVDCARLSPCGGNMQSLRFLAVSSPEKCERFYPALAWAAYLKDWPGPVEAERPTGYVVILVPLSKEDRTPPNTMIDVGIAAQSMQLAAWSRGIGACMFRSFSSKSIAEVLPVPEDYEVAMVLAFGHALEERRLVPVGEDESIRYYRDASGVHYVPKRALKEVLLGEF